MLRTNKYWTLITIFLIAIIIIGGVVVWVRYEPDQKNHWDKAVEDFKYDSTE